MPSARGIEGVLVASIVGSLVLVLSGGARALLRPGSISEEAAHLGLTAEILAPTVGVLSRKSPTERLAAEVHPDSRVVPGAIGGPAPREANRDGRSPPGTDGATASNDRRAETPSADVGSLMNMSDQFRRAIRDWRGR